MSKTVRRWIAGRLESVSCWLEARSEDVRNMSSRIRPAAKPHPLLSEMISVTLRNHSHRWTAEAVSNNALLKGLKEHNG